MDGTDEEDGMDVFRFCPLSFAEVRPRGRQARPMPRSGHRLVCDGSDLYLFGGFCPRLSPQHASQMDADPVWAESRPLFKELWRFNMAAREWRRLPCEASLPRELASSAACMRGGVVFLFGGSGFPFGSACSNRVFRYEARAGGEVRELQTSGARPRPMYGQAVLLVGPHLYAVGGTTGFEFSSDVHRLDLRAGRWEEVYVSTGAAPEEPSGRYRHELALHGERLFLIGGGTGDRACSLKSVHAFHLRERRWERLATHEDDAWGFPSSRRYHGFAQLGAGAYVVGGFDRGQILGDAWRLDLGSLRWSVLPSCSLRQSVYFHATAVTPAGCLYSFGGVKALEGDCTRSGGLCRAWLCVPSLEEMCREAVRHYARRCPLFSRDRLASCGLPPTVLAPIFS
ncbi:kelch domain-containing protein 10 [Bacillus rossius redtenbacheri]|uniref:kelch domain-containing protein 10 n=1 Tax=Bacillus rossius redtenbacheri TaxID=93214 RepID=UPI002FDDCF77